MINPGRRTLRSWTMLAGILLALGGVALAVVSSEGRPGIEVAVNDGGAWLVSRDDGAIAHLNREVLEVTAAVRFSAGGSDIEVDQADGIISIHDRSDDRFVLLDERTYARRADFILPSDATVVAVDAGVVIYQSSPIRVWHLSVEDLFQVSEIDEVEPVFESEHPGVVGVNRAGTVLVAEPLGGAADTRVTSIRGRTVNPVFDESEGPGITRLIPIGDWVIIQRGDNLYEAGNPTPLATEVEVAQQAVGDSFDRVAWISRSGQVFVTEIDSGVRHLMGDISPNVTTEPILFRSCVFALSRDPSEFFKFCPDGSNERTGLSGGELSLRLVNGWVWINELDTGGAWVASADADLSRLDDWGSALASTETDESEATVDQTDLNADQRENPDSDDARFVAADELDEDLENEPPVAGDDRAATRSERPLVVNVLANDVDTDGDVLFVSEVDGVVPSARLELVPGAGGIQVTPDAGFVGPIGFAYTVSDGRGGTARGSVTIDVVPLGPSGNTAPVAITDVATTRAGSAVALNVLDNDTDPEGDTLVLVSVTAPSGVVSYGPGGEMLFVPDLSSQDGVIELGYEVSDEYGATSEGTVKVLVRLAESNTPPDARNDMVQTSLGGSARLNVLDNDRDPDNDPMYVAKAPEVQSGPGGISPEEVGEVTLTPDGDFYFVPTAAGTYRFEYLISDGQNNDRAQIRVEVAGADAEGPPVAVRDDIAIPIGGTRLVYVLENDWDPNGDVVGLVSWEEVDGLSIREIPGVGFEVGVEVGAPGSLSFHYSISDGSDEYSVTKVVVAVVGEAVENQPPRPVSDSFEVRAGRTSRLPVVANDRDPEGGSLVLARVPDLVDSPVHVRVGSDGQTVEMSIPPDATRGFTFGYEVADPEGAVGAATVDVRIIDPSQPNRAPFAHSDVGRTIEGHSTTLDVLANDSDPDSDFVTVESISSQPRFGRAEIADDGGILYVPHDGFRGTDRFSYVITDTEGARSVGDVEVGVMPQPIVNRAPKANPDRFVVLAGSEPVRLDVLANDTDPDGDLLTVIEVGGAGIGTATTDRSQVIFTPPASDELAAGQSVGVSLYYEISDGAGHTDDSLVTITVESEPAPVAPVARDDSAGPVRARTEVSVPVLANDSDPDGSPDDLVVSSDDPRVRVVGGFLEITAEISSTQYSYTVTDVDGLSDRATVTLFVVENEAPQLSPLAVTTEFGVAVTVDLGAQASDADGDPLFFVCCDSVHNGSVSIDSSGEGTMLVTLTPNDGFSGEASFSYSVDDQQGHLVSGSVVVTVQAPDNRPPEIVAPGVLEVEAGSAVPFDLATLARDPDPSDSLTAEITAAPNGVEVSIDGTTITVVAPDDSSGVSGAIEFTVTDSGGESASGVVEISVSPTTRPAPTAVSDQATTPQGLAVSVDVLANDIDPMGGGLTLIQVGATQAGTTSDTGGGTIGFSPSPDFFGVATFTYTVGDSTQDPARRSVGQITVDVIGRPDSPAAPSSVADSGRATLTWSSPPDNGATVDSYRLTVRDISTGSESTVDLGAQNSYVATGLVNGDEYDFRLEAHNSSGWGDPGSWSPPVRPDTTPDRPVAPTVTFDNSQLLVSWSAPTNQGSSVTEYKLEIGGGESSLISLPPASTTYPWSGLTNGTEYQFRVVATNRAGDSDPSGWSDPEHPLSEPSPPSAPSVTRGDRFLDLAWVRPDNNGDPIGAYEIEIESTGQLVSVTGANTTGYRWAQLVNGTEYRFRVRGSNRDPDPGGWSGWSTPVKPCAVPDTPGAVSAVRGDRLASVGWATPGDQGCAITAYNVRVNGGAVQAVGANANTMDYAGLTNGSIYSFEVQAVNSEGASAWSTASANVVPAGPPTAPSAVAASPSAIGQITVGWTGAQNNGDPITSQQMRINGGTNTSVSGSSSIRAGLNNSTSYSFELRACNSVSCGPWSASASATTWGPPSPPASVSAQSGLNAGTNLFWAAPSSDGGRPIISYEILVNPGSSTVAGPAATSMVISPLVNGTTYTISVRACNSVGCGQYTSTTATPQAPPPTAAISVGGPYSGPNCVSGDCNWVEVSAQNMPANTSINVKCFSSRSGQFKSYWVTTDGGGTTNHHNCHYGFPGETVWVTVNGTTSNSLLWP